MKEGIPRAPVIVNSSLNGMDRSKMSDVRSKSDGQHTSAPTCLSGKWTATYHQSLPGYNVE